LPDTSSAIIIILITLPGFVGYLCFAKIYCRKVEDTIEKVAYIVLFNALSLSVLSLFIDVSVIASIDFAKGNFPSVVHSAQGTLSALSAVAAIIGIGLAAALNLKAVDAFFLRCGLTRKTGHESVLSDVIRTNSTAFWKVRFKSGGYVIGHPRRYSLDGDEEMLFLCKAARRPARIGDKPQQPEYEIEGPGVLIVKFDDVAVIELLDGNEP
jgi:hypothetical protein